MASQNNITLVEIKLYENKITVTNFPEIIKGESHIITFTITKLIKDYGEYTSDASLIWKKLSPKSSILLMRNSNGELYKIYNSKKYSNACTFEINSEFLKIPGPLELQLILYNSCADISIEKTPIFMSKITDSLDEDDGITSSSLCCSDLKDYIDFLNKENVKSINHELPDEKGNINLSSYFPTMDVFISLVERVKILESYHIGEEPPVVEPEYIYYGRLLASEIGITTRAANYREITANMLTDNAQFVTNSKNPPRLIKCEPKLFLEATSLGWSMKDDNNDEVAEYFIIAVPKNMYYLVTKDDGTGGKTDFEEEISGVNGVDLKINGTDYLLYGEISVVPTELYFYINN